MVPVVRNDINQDAPWTWRLDDVLGLLSDRQRRYVESLPRIFRLRTAAGKVVPYKMEPYQAYWHSYSPLALGKKAPSRIVEKGRGLGLTLMAAIDALMLAKRDEAITIPVAGRAGDTSDEFIEKTWHLLDDAIDPNSFDPRRDVRTRVEILHNGSPSRIVPMPGGSPEKVRSKRTVHAVLDEFAFHEYAERLWRAIRGSQSEGGTLDVLSTHNGADTLYYRLLDDAKAHRNAFQVFHFPVCDPRAWRQDRPVHDQVKDGLKLLAPWIDLGVFDEFRREDPLGCAQEMLCDVMDAALNLLSREAVAKATDASLPDWAVPLSAEFVAEWSTIATASVPRRPSDDQEAVYVGVDFARTGDLSAYTAWSTTIDGPRQRWLDVLHGQDTPTQAAYLDAIIESVRPAGVLIDMTGNGTGLFDIARRKHGGLVKGIHASQSLYMGGTRPTPANKAMALTLAEWIQGGSAKLLGNARHADIQRRHLLAVRRADLDAPRNAEGHADIFWANALALWGVRVVQPQPPQHEDTYSVDLSEMVATPEMPSIDDSF
jgi:phage FluMu gp28-like protein